MYKNPIMRTSSLIISINQVFEAQGQNCKMRPLLSVIEPKGRRGRKQRNLGALSEPCRLLLLGGSLNTSNEALKTILMLIDEAPGTLRPWDKLPPLPLPLRGPVPPNKKIKLSSTIARTSSNIVLYWNLTPLFLSSVMEANRAKESISKLGGHVNEKAHDHSQKEQIWFWKGNFCQNVSLL